MNKTSDPFISNDLKAFYVPWNIRNAFEENLEGLNVPVENECEKIFIHFYFQMKTFVRFDNNLIVRAFVKSKSNCQEKTFYLEKKLYDFLKDKSDMCLYITKDYQIKSSLIGELCVSDI